MNLNRTNKRPWTSLDFAMASSNKGLGGDSNHCGRLYTPIRADHRARGTRHPKPLTVSNAAYLQSERGLGVCAHEGDEGSPLNRPIDTASKELYKEGEGGLDFFFFFVLLNLSLLQELF